MDFKYTIWIIFCPDWAVNFTGCCVLCSNSILVDTHTTRHEIWCHLRQIWYFTKEKTLICLFPTINRNKSEFLLESFWFWGDFSPFKPPITHSEPQQLAAAAEFHPQTLTGDGWGGERTIVLKFSLQFESWSVPFPILFGISDVCLIRDADTVSALAPLGLHP